MQRRGTGRHDGGADIVVRTSVRGGGGTRTGGHDIHARTEEVGLLDRLDRLHWLELWGRLGRNGRFYLLSGLKGENRSRRLRRGGGETWVCGRRGGSLEVIELIICRDIYQLSQNGSRKGTIPSREAAGWMVCGGGSEGALFDVGRADPPPKASSSAKPSKSTS